MIDKSLMIKNDQQLIQLKALKVKQLPEGYKIKTSTKKSFNLQTKILLNKFN